MAVAVATHEGAGNRTFKRAICPMIGRAVNSRTRVSRAFRAMLDVLESGDFNHTYFPLTVGLLGVLALSGNFPTV
jgi:hypothetical protein